MHMLCKLPLTTKPRHDNLVLGCASSDDSLVCVNCSEPHGRTDGQTDGDRHTQRHSYPCHCGCVLIGEDRDEPEGSHHAGHFKPDARDGVSQQAVPQ